MGTDRTVYSTDPRFCAACGKSPCVCAVRVPGKARQPNPVYLSFQRGGKGSGVTRIEGIVLHPRLKEELLQKLKRRFGCGGTIKDGTLEVQGDRRDAVEAELISEGYRIKRAGG
ncbi:MAG TPA: translation initiation factor [Elusimicrobiota bacterium]|jgi:translation initiation factor 1|nr:translation initiation factor [Elusimicrobiota bacterium]